jgi:putative phage-type endonuclease
MDRSIDSREFRRTYIGGGDAAAIAGVSPWGSPFSCWQEKVGDAPERDVSERMRWGLILEGPVAHEWASRAGVTNLRKATFRRHPDVEYVGGHPDYYAVHPQDGPVILEVKTSGSPADWEGPDGDQVPIHYYLQVQHYLMVTGYQTAHIAALLRGSELRSYRVPGDAEVQAGLLAAYAEFWDLVTSGTPPEIDGHEATAEAIRRRFPRSEDEEIVGDQADEDFVRMILEARTVKANAEAQEELAKNRLMSRMGTATRLLLPSATVTWRTSKDRTVVNWEAVAKAYQKVLEENGHLEADEIEAVQSIHTGTLPGARPFRVTEKQEVQG